MRDYLSTALIFLSILLFVLCLSIMPLTLINDYLIYSSVVVFGLLFAFVYILKFKNTIKNRNDFFLIPIRCIFSFGFILVFSLLLINYYLRDHNVFTVKNQVISSYTKYSPRGGKFSKRFEIQSVFVINYKNQTKNIILNSKLEDSIMKNIKTIELNLTKGFLGIDIIENSVLIHKD